MPRSVNPAYPTPSLPELLSYGLLLLAPLGVSLSVFRDALFSSHAFVAFPVVAALSALGFQLVLRRRLRGTPSWLNFAVIALICLLSLVPPTLADSSYTGAILKSVAMLLIAGVVPACLALSSGPVRSVYVLAHSVVLLGGGLILFSVLFPEFFFVRSRESYSPELTSWFINPNTFGAIAMVVLACQAALYLDSPWPLSRLSRLLMPIVAISNVIALWRSHSRGAIAAALLGIGLTVFWRQKTRPSKWLLMAQVSLLAAAPLLALNLPLDIAEERLLKHASGEYAGGRFGLWLSMLDYWWTTAPLLGLGLTGSNEVAVATGASGAHNSFIRALTDFGLVGSVLLSVVIGRIVVALRRMSRPGLWVLLIVLGFHGLVENHLFTLATSLSGLFFWQFSMMPKRRVHSNRGA